MDQQSYFSNKIQEIQATPDGSILSSTNTIFDLDSVVNLYSLHPFFESLKPELAGNTKFRKSLAFPCVQLEINGKIGVCDITVKKERGFLAVLLFDYTEHYAHLHEAAQEKKSALLHEQAFQLKAEHKEERKKYIEFMRSRIDEHIISELEQIADNVENLKKITDNSKQLGILGKIEESIQKFQQEADRLQQDLDADID